MGLLYDLVEVLAFMVFVSIFFCVIINSSS